MMSTRQYAELAVFKGMAEAEVEALLRQGQRMEMGDGQIVIRQGDSSEELFCVLSGGVEVLRETGVGPRSIAIIKPGHCFGEIGFFAGERRTATIRTVAHSELLSLGSSDIEALMASNPLAAARFLRNVMEIVSERFAEMNTNLASMVFWLGN